MTESEKKVNRKKKKKGFGGNRHDTDQAKTPRHFTASFIGKSLDWVNDRTFKKPDQPITMTEVQRQFFPSNDKDGNPRSQTTIEVQLTQDNHVMKGQKVLITRSGFTDENGNSLPIEPTSITVWSVPPWGIAFRKVKGNRIIIQ